MSRSNQQKIELRRWFKDTLGVDSASEQKAIIKEFCDYTGFKPPRAALNKAVKQSRWDNWRIQWLINRWAMFELWIREEVRKAQTVSGNANTNTNIKTPADSLMSGMLTV